jgi:hypothetical protein
MPAKAQAQQSMKIMLSKKQGIRALFSYKVRMNSSLTEL